MGLIARQQRRPVCAYSEDECLAFLRDTLDWYSIPEPNSGCLLWIGSVDKDGYGKITLNMIRPKKRYIAHRVSYMLANGPIPPEMDILHSCDLSACINPRHLRIGTKADNGKDARLRNRTATGERAARHKLTTDQVERILVDNRRHSYIARDYGVAHVTISAIKYGRTWKHIS